MFATLCGPTAPRRPPPADDRRRDFSISHYPRKDRDVDDDDDDDDDVDADRIRAEWGLVLSSRLGAEDPADDAGGVPDLSAAGTAGGGGGGSRSGKLRLRTPTPRHRRRRPPRSSASGRNVGGRRGERRVRFEDGGGGNVAFVPSAKELDADERAAAWYTPEEQSANRAECTHVINRMRRGLSIDETRTTRRGLERHRSDEHISARRRRKETVVRAVLEEQATQVARRRGGREEEGGGTRGRGRDEEEEEEEGLREASLRISSISRDIALTAAKWDEAAAGWEEEETEETTTTELGTEEGKETPEEDRDALMMSTWREGDDFSVTEPEKFTFDGRTMTTPAPGERFAFERPRLIITGDWGVELCRRTSTA